MGVNCSPATASRSSSRQAVRRSARCPSPLETGLGGPHFLTSGSRHFEGALLQGRRRRGVRPQGVTKRSDKAHLTALQVGAGEEVAGGEGCEETRGGEGRGGMASMGEALFSACFDGQAREARSLLSGGADVNDADEEG